MSEIDYSKIGLKCGIEIHQQLDTERKLFCGCMARFSEAKPQMEVVRRLRVVAGETGDIDVAALGETAKGMEFVYKVYQEESCLVETDEEPPHSLNMEALDITLTIAEMLKCEVPEEMHMMRKTVLDGSNTSGFQRTAVVGLNGKMKTSFGTVGIANLSLEEESAQILDRQGNRIVYGLDRLGIPLVEIGTSPDIHSPEQAKEVAEKLGMIVRSTGKVKRGLGTIRQDINVSIAGGARIEIKGAQELRLIPKLVENEALRQANLLAIKNDLKKKRFRPVRPKLAHVTHIFRGSESKITKDKATYAILIPGFAGFLKRALTPSRTLGNEIADYVRAKSELKGIIHSDEELEKYKLTKEFESLKKEMKAKKGDTLIIAVGDKRRVGRTMDVVAERINHLIVGVPNEVRRAKDDDTEYMRPLPGAARLYPETDIPPIRITGRKLAEIRKNLPELLEETEERHKKEIVHKFHISEEITKQVVRAGKKHLFDAIVETGADPKVIANTLVSTLPYLKRKEGVHVEKITEAHFIALFEKMKSGQITKEAIPDVLKALAAEPSLDIENAIRKTKIRPLTTDDLKIIIGNAIEANGELVGSERGEKILLGLVMQKVRGKISPVVVMSELEITLKKRKQAK